MKIGLTLGGGGARGAAHVGVLMEMRRIGLEPHIITGNSIGGLIGALIACGLSEQRMLDFMEQMRLANIYKLPIGFAGLASNENFENLLVETIGRPTFEELDIKLAVTATDLVRRKLVVMSSGDIVSAVLATTAIPGILPPVEREGLTLVDGGLLDNIPFNAALSHGATHILAIDLSNVAAYGEKTIHNPDGSLIERTMAAVVNRPTIQVILAAIDVITANSVNARTLSNHPDVLLRPYLGSMNTFDFHLLREAAEAGRAAFIENERRIHEIFFTPGEEPHQTMEES